MGKRFASFKAIAGLDWDGIMSMFVVSVENSGGKVRLTLCDDDFKIYNTFPDETFSSDGLVPFDLLGSVSSEIERIHSFIREGIDGKTSGSAEDCLLKILVEDGFDLCYFSSGDLNIVFEGGSVNVSKVSRSVVRGSDGELSVIDRFCVDDSDMSVELESTTLSVKGAEEAWKIIERIRELSSDIVEI